MVCFCSTPGGTERMATNTQLGGVRVTDVVGLRCLAHNNATLKVQLLVTLLFISFSDT